MYIKYHGFKCECGDLLQYLTEKIREINMDVGFEYAQLKTENM